MYVEAFNIQCDSADIVSLLLQQHFPVSGIFGHSPRFLYAAAVKALVPPSLVVVALPSPAPAHSQTAVMCVVQQEGNTVNSVRSGEQVLITWRQLLMEP